MDAFVESFRNFENNLDKALYEFDTLSFNSNEMMKVVNHLNNLLTNEQSEKVFSQIQDLNTIKGRMFEVKKAMIEALNWDRLVAQFEVTVKNLGDMLSEPSKSNSNIIFDQMKLCIDQTNKVEASLHILSCMPSYTDKREHYQTLKQRIYDMVWSNLTQHICKDLKTNYSSNIKSMDHELWLLSLKCLKQVHSEVVKGFEHEEDGSLLIISIFDYIRMIAIEYLSQLIANKAENFNVKISKEGESSTFNQDNLIQLTNYITKLWRDFLLTQYDMKDVVLQQKNNASFHTKKCTSPPLSPANQLHYFGEKLNEKKINEHNNKEKTHKLLQLIWHHVIKPILLSNLMQNYLLTLIKESFEQKNIIEKTIIINNNINHQQPLSISDSLASNLNLDEQLLNTLQKYMVVLDTFVVTNFKNLPGRNIELVYEFFAIIYGPYYTYCAKQLRLIYDEKIRQFNQKLNHKTDINEVCYELILTTYDLKIMKALTFGSGFLSFQNSYIHKILEILVAYYTQKCKYSQQKLNVSIKQESLQTSYVKTYLHTQIMDSMENIRRIGEIMWHLSTYLEANIINLDWLNDTPNGMKNNEQQSSINKNHSFILPPQTKEEFQGVLKQCMIAIESTELFDDTINNNTHDMDNTKLFNICKMLLSSHINVINIDNNQAIYIQDGEHNVNSLDSLNHKHPYYTNLSYDGTWFEYLNNLFGFLQWTPAKIYAEYMKHFSPLISMVLQDQQSLFQYPVQQWLCVLAPQTYHIELTVDSKKRNSITHSNGMEEHSMHSNNLIGLPLPSEYMTEIGQYLLMLPQHLDNYSFSTPSLLASNNDNDNYSLPTNSNYGDWGKNALLNVYRYYYLYFEEEYVTHNNENKHDTSNNNNNVKINNNEFPYETVAEYWLNNLISYISHELMHLITNRLHVIKLTTLHQIHCDLDYFANLTQDLGFEQSVRDIDNFTLLIQLTQSGSRMEYIKCLQQYYGVVETTLDQSLLTPNSCGEESAFKFPPNTAKQFITLFERIQWTT